jgi:2-polyprenyl-3-methyl-5-hydroxy-6-metoxy-1,4-benzoquinol methylase
MVGNVAYTGLRWDHLTAMSRLRPTQSLLDIGGGNGTFAVSASEMCKDVVAVDFSGSFPTRTEANVRFLSASLDLGKSEVISLPRPINGETYDVITAFQVFEHLRDPLGLIATCASSLSHGGLLMFSVPNSKRFSHAYLQGLDFPPHHLHWWNTRSLQVAVERSGLQLEAMAVERNWSPKSWVGGVMRWLKSRRHSDLRIPDIPGRPWPPARLTLGHSILVVARKP